MAQAVVSPSLPRERSRARLDAGASAIASSAPAVRWRPVALAALPGLLVSCWAGLATMWDGASFLFRIVHEGRPEILHGRVGSVIWQLPAVLASRSGASVGTTRVLFGLGFAVVPVLALWLAWLIVRDADPRLFACAACGILALASPAQAFFVGEMLISLQLGWVLLLTAATGGTTTWGRRLFAPVAILILLTHPVAAFVLVAAAGIFMLRWWSDGRRSLTRRELGLTGALVVVALLRVLVINGYERENADDLALTVAVRAFGSQDWLLGLGLGAVGVAVLVLVTRSRSRAPYALLAAGAVGLGIWAADVASWEDAVNWRVFDTALMLPALLGVVIVVMRPTSWSVGAVRRGTAFAVGCGAIASLVLVMQSFGWRDATNDLRAELRATPSGCVAFNDLESVERSPIGSHWGTSMLALEVQGLRPRVLVLRNRHLCERYARTGAAELWPWGDVVEDGGAGGRFDLPAAG